MGFFLDTLHVNRKIETYYLYVSSKETFFCSFVSGIKINTFNSITSFQISRNLVLQSKVKVKFSSKLLFSDIYWKYPGFSQPL